MAGYMQIHQRGEGTYIPINGSDSLELATMETAVEIHSRDKIVPLRKYRVVVQSTGEDGIYEARDLEELLDNLVRKVGQDGLRLVQESGSSVDGDRHLRLLPEGSILRLLLPSEELIKQRETSKYQLDTASSESFGSMGLIPPELQRFEQISRNISSNYQNRDYKAVGTNTTKR